MGKNIISQRRGRGTSTYRSPSHRFIARISYPKYDQKQRDGVLAAQVRDIFHDPGHSAPIAQIQYENGQKDYIFAYNGMHTNKVIFFGSQAKPETGNIMPLKNIPIGATVFNIENSPGDGGKFIRAAGSFATVAAKTDSKVTILFPSKKQKDFDPQSRATIGVLASSGRKDKPFVKAGKRHHAMRARGKLYPLTSGVAMNAVDHPFGSGRGRHIGKPKNAPRFAPPGRNVGSIRARRTGKKR